MMIQIRSLVASALLTALSFAGSAALAADYYVDAKNGSDAADGKSPAAAWKTLSRVGDADEIAPGDVVRFRAGCVWRETLRPRSGEEGNPVTYTSYGDGPKPSFWRSVSLAKESDWTKIEENIWTTRDRDVKSVAASEPLDPRRWSLYQESGAKVAYSADKEKGAFSFKVETAGTASNHVQWIYAPFAIENAQSLRLSFDARASEPTTFPISLMATTAPYSSYGSASAFGELTTEFRGYEVYLEPTVSSQKARLTVYFGNLPAGMEIEVKNLRFEAVNVDELHLAPDVGNIILDGTAAAFKRWNRGELKAQDDYFYNRVDGKIWYYSEQNPAANHTSVEAAVMTHVVNLSGVHDAIFDGLDIRNGAAHGFGGSGNKRCVIRNCDICWIGGGDQYREGGEGRRTRFGNGIEFWSDAEDHLVENCRIWEVYDAAITNQGAGTNVERNIVYRNNKIWNCEYSFEYWNRDETSVTDNILFTNNECLNAGYGWGHVQRPDKNGRCLMFYSNSAQTTNFKVVNNVFANATESLVRSDIKWTPEQPFIDNNVYWQDDASLPYARWLRENYSADQFDEYRKAGDVEANGVIKKIDVSKLIPTDVK